MTIKQPNVDSEIQISDLKAKLPNISESFLQAARAALLGLMVTGCINESPRKPTHTEQKMDNMPTVIPANEPPTAILPVMPDDQPRTPPIPDEIGTPDEEKPLV